MKRWYRELFCSLLLIFVQSICGVSRPVAPHGISQNARQLQLSTSIVRREYCDTDHLRLKLRFRFTNTGSEAVILFKRSTAVFREMFSRNYKDAMERRYVHDIEAFVTPVMSATIERATPNELLLVVLKPNESYEVDDDFHVFVFNGTKETVDDLRPGRYFLKIGVLTWWWGENKAEMLRERWQAYGRLWSDDLTSVPMPIDIEKPGAVVRCS